MESGEYGLTRGTCFLARRLELDAVAELLWISSCVLGGVDFFVRVFFPDFALIRTHTACAASMTSPCLIYLSTSSTGTASE